MSHSGLGSYRSHAESIGVITLYAIEEQIREQNLSGEHKRQHRLTHSKPRVEAFFAWIDRQFERQGLLPSNPFTPALGYVRERRVGLAVFLEINPYDYLVDVLQRVGQHPATRVADLTPRLWKQHFAAAPLRSDLYACSPVTGNETAQLSNKR